MTGSYASGRDAPLDGVAAIIPALDEEAALPGVLGELREAGLERVVVVDNGSTDGTAEAARRAGARVVREEERGYGAACLAGMAALAGDATPPDVIVFLDADGSDDPAALPRLLAPLRDAEADLVVGVRSSGETPSAEIPLHARLGNALVLAGARVLHGARLADLGPFRAIRRTALDRLQMDDRNWGWTLQMQIRAHRAGLEVREVRVPHRARRGGRSKVSGTLGGSLRAGTKMFVVLLRELGGGPADSNGGAPGSRGRAPGSGPVPPRAEGGPRREG